MQGGSVGSRVGLLALRGVVEPVGVVVMRCARRCDVVRFGCVGRRFRGDIEAQCGSGRRGPRAYMG